MNPKEKTLVFANGQVADYDGIVSSIPLPDFIPMINGVPEDVLEASQKLACSSCLVVNIGVDRADISETHISYFYDPDIVFTRLSFPHKMSPQNVPAGCSSIQAEIYFSSKYKPLNGTPEELCDRVVEDLIRCGLLDATDTVLCKHSMMLDYANVIFDLDRAGALDVVHGYLDDLGIAYCGRYGEWDYIWTDDSFKSGEQAAASVLQHV